MFTKNSSLLIVSLLLLFSYVGANAQEFKEYPSSARDEKGRIVRSGYVTNEWYDNWAISAGGGVSTLTADGNTMMVSPSYELNLTKWATPAIAFRFGLQGYQGREKFTPDFWNHSPLPYDPSTNTVSWDYFYAYADLMWCASNTLFGYRFRRFYSFTPYLQGGYQRIFDPKAYKTNYDREAVFGAGLLNTFRITDRIKLTLDLRATNFSARFHDNAQGGRATQLTATAGLAFNIFKPGWKRVREIESARDAAVAAGKRALSDLKKAEEANRKLNSDNIGLRDRYGRLEEEMNALKAVAAAEAESKGGDELLRRIAEAGLVIYYDINDDTIRSCEELHINDYVNAVLNVDPEHVFYITGSADKGTGTTEINTKLSNARVNEVKEYLINVIGIPESRVVIKGAIISDKHEDGRIDRCVLFENK